jgi:sulfur-oxidizing protein SoxA
MPRYFADADKVMDVEARIVWCMETLQGLARKEILKSPFPAGGQPVGDVGAIATFVATKSRGKTFAVKLDHPREKEAFELGQALFFRRQGPMDFACATCHGEAGRRIRLQELPFLSKPEEARKVVGEWPAYRVSSTHVMTMTHRIYDCFWQMRLPQVEHSSEVTIALTMYLARTAEGGEISAPSIKR